MRHLINIILEFMDTSKLNEPTSGSGLPAAPAASGGGSGPFGWHEVDEETYLDACRHIGADYGNDHGVHYFYVGKKGNEVVCVASWEGSALHGLEDANHVWFDSEDGEADICVMWGSYNNTAPASLRPEVDKLGQQAVARQHAYVTAMSDSGFYDAPLSSAHPMANKTVRDFDQ